MKSSVSERRLCGSRVDHKMSEQGNMYSVEQAEDILNRIHTIRKSLIIGRQEKHELMQVRVSFVLLNLSLAIKNLIVINFMIFASFM